ncbi:FAD-dependent oxidoreductase [Streptomyces sp. NBC_00996]|uniref:FAD-dependent oxidoreductase n=1 Tax=Streptomyces sp. NBC_00996 TaxID=2903710 RepID=UPI0038660BF4|nr:FAD-binding oxidoreductase [Streptomyces sp. NBC_00996]
MTTDETIVVVGGGVSGLTTGIALLEAGLPVRLLAAEIPARTSLAAGAMWGPYLVEPWPRARGWSLTALEVFRELAGDPRTGVCMVSGIEAARHPASAPDWGELLPDLRRCTTDELPPGFAVGYHFTVPLIDMPVYLSYLQGRFADAGGMVEVRMLASIDEVERAAALVNCAGLGAGPLVGDDGLRPIRGQHVVVENPGISEFFSEDTGMSPDLACIYPHGDTVVLGGTAIDGDGTLAPDSVAAAGILARCAAIDPRLANAHIIEDRIGARPTRYEVRLELDHRSDGLPLVHNYGHGGAGVTLSWGCAREVAQIMKVALPSRSKR